MPSRLPTALIVIATYACAGGRHADIADVAARHHLGLDWHDAQTTVPGDVCAADPPRR